MIVLLGPPDPELGEGRRTYEIAYFGGNSSLNVTCHGIDGRHFTDEEILWHAGAGSPVPLEAVEAVMLVEALPEQLFPPVQRQTALKPFR